MTGHCDIPSFNKFRLEEVSRHSEKGGVRMRRLDHLKPSDISVWSCTLKQRKPIPETETPYADTAIKKCFPYDNWMLQRSECSTFWMEIKASCNATLTWSECAKNPLLGLPSVDGIQGEKGFPSGYISQHSPQWPPGSKVKQTYCQLKPDQLVWQHMEKGRWALVMDN